MSGHDSRLQQNEWDGLSGVALGVLCLKEPGLRTGGAGTKHSSVRLRFWTRALAPGAGNTFGKPGVLLSPDALRPPGGVEDSLVSVRPRENLKEKLLISLKRKL